MRYNVETTSKSTVPDYRIGQFHELTHAAWVMEGAEADLAYGWRGLARANGIADPMQVAGELPRTKLGSTLVPGQVMLRP